MKFCGILKKLYQRFRLKLHTDTTQPDTLSFSTFLQRMARDAILLPEDGSSLLGPADI